MVLGPQQPSHPLELPGGQHSVDFYVEGLAFPDVNFPGLISLTISLLDTSNPVGQDGSLRGHPSSRALARLVGGGTEPCQEAVGIGARPW